jgi:hypothetical protein
MKRLFLNGCARKNIDYLQENNLLKCFFSIYPDATSFATSAFFMQYWKEKWDRLDKQRVQIAAVEEGSIIDCDIYFTKHHVFSFLLLPILYYHAKKQDKYDDSLPKTIVKSFVCSLTGAFDMLDKNAFQKGVQAVLASYYLECVELIKKEKTVDLTKQFSALSISKNKKQGPY